MYAQTATARSRRSIVTSSLILTHCYPYSGLLGSFNNLLRLITS
jgi:hypothetical protein